MLLDDGVVTYIAIDEKGAVETIAEALLARL